MAVTNYYTVEGEIIGEKTAGSTRVDYLTDALGSVTATVNQSAQVVNTYRYNPYGSLLAKTGTGPDPAVGWVGTKGYRPTQKKFSDFYVRARHYGEDTGQWSTRDPMLRSYYRYVYTRDLPIQYVDPTGRALIGGDTTGCPGGFIDYLQNTCCPKIGDNMNDIRGGSEFENRIDECMAKKGFTNENTIGKALDWLVAACNKNPSVNASVSANICVFCFINGQNNKFPKDLPDIINGFMPALNPCVTGGRSYGGFPIATFPIPIEGTGGCEKKTPLPGLQFPGNLSNKDKSRCDAAIIYCQQQSDSVTCSDLFHELIHVGGLAGNPNRHGGLNPADDFIYALQCCLCREFYSAAVCDNAKPVAACGAWHKVS